MKINAINQINNLTFTKKDTEATQSGNRSIKNITLPVLNSILFTPSYQKRYQKFLKALGGDGLEMAQLVEDYARQYVIYKDEKLKIAQMTKDHYYIAYLDSLLRFAREIEKGNMDYDKDATPTAEYTRGFCADTQFSKTNISKTISIIENEYRQVQKDLQEKSTKNGFVSSVFVEEDFMDDIDDFTATAMAETGVQNFENFCANEACFMVALTTATRSSTYAYTAKIREFFHKLSIGATTEGTDKNEPVMPYYKDLATRVIKNADRNYNMQVTYDTNDESAPDYFVNSLIEELKNVHDGEYKNIKKDKTKTIVFNKFAKLNVIADECLKFEKDPDTQYFVVIKDIYKTFYGSTVAGENGLPVIVRSVLNNSIGQKAKNIHLILLNNQDNFYALSSDPSAEKIIRDYQNMQIPIMDSNALVQQVLATKDYIKSEIETDIEDEALTYITSLPLNSKGSDYDNVIRFIKNIASYYVDSEIITKDMAKIYWESAQKDEISTSDNSYDLIFDTKKGLDDIVGTPMVKKQAEKVVYELKNFPKTKGYILQNAYGALSGRMNCAKAIAGELKIPIVSINAADFAMRDLDTVNQDPMKAIEVKMSKLINTMKTQAQANPNKMVMLYISNFDHFASDPLYGISSIYEQQAFQKLLKEMKRSSDDDGYNIVVMGASDYPEATNQAIIRPGLFIDNITIYPPQTQENIKEIATRHIAQKNYKLEDEQKTLSHFLKLMNGSIVDYVDNIDLLDRANILAHERGSETISIPDLNKAYLNRTVGEVSDSDLSDVHKETVIRHEGGHALNLQFMYNLFKEKGDNLRIGDSIINIVLDPRGDYGGCVYHTHSPENTFQVNMETIMSDLICSFGGNSSEEHFYDMEGSWGVSADRMNANELAKFAVLYMGLGARMKHYIPDIDPEYNIPILSPSDEEDYIEDVKTLLENAKIASDKIVKCYEDFLKEFSAKNISKYGTGDCIVTGDDFALSLKEWEERQPDEKKQEIASLKNQILALIQYTKKGIVYSSARKNDYACLDIKEEEPKRTKVRKANSKYRRY